MESIKVIVIVLFLGSCCAKIEEKLEGDEDGVPSSHKYTQEAQDQCFCQLKGHVDDCECDVNTVDYFNNKQIFPRLQSLLVKDFFRYFEYNPSKKCIFFNSTVTAGDKCTSQRCRVHQCPEDQLPPGIKGDDGHQKNKNCAGISGEVDNTLSDEARKDIEDWRQHDESSSGFCDVDSSNCKDCIHVDLTRNPERYTGYKGEAAHEIWRTIYEENCFRPPGTAHNNDIKTSVPRSPYTIEQRTRKAKATKLLKKFFVPNEQLGELCLEKRAFYRAVSGLHASITIHLTARFPKELVPEYKSMATANKVAGILLQPASGPFGGNSAAADDSDMFGANVEEFLSRFDPETTQGQGPFWLRNLYFVYLLEMRAIMKAKPFLEKQTFYTGNEEEDKETVIAVKELLNVISSFPDHYDETELFSTVDGEHSKESNERLKVEFKDHFRNVSRVMDCVSCDKCRLWGKLQVTGLGTALKILLGEDQGPSQLSRQEIVSLFNAFGRISTSIQQLENFRQQLRYTRTPDSSSEGDKLVTPMRFT